MQLIKKIGMILFLYILINENGFAQLPGHYYGGFMGLNGSVLQDTLNNIISKQLKYSYDEVWDILKDSDKDPNNIDNIIMVYCARSRNKNQVDLGASFDYSSTDYTRNNSWNREHIWSQSHGEFGYTNGVGTDVHNLKPADFNVNSSRNNLDFDNGGNAHAEAVGCFYDADSWEPRDEMKGDIARIIFYMTVRYDGEAGEPNLTLAETVNNSPNPIFGKLSTLLEWNRNDPPDDFERRRNDVIYNWQKNRNPFIDYPVLADLIWGGKSAGNIKIFNFKQNPTLVNSSSSVNLAASITTKSGTITKAVLYYGYSYNNLSDSITMSLVSGKYTADILAGDEASRLYYKIKATNSLNESDVLRGDFIVKKTLEPGDVIIVGFNTSTWGAEQPDCSNNKDNFAFIPLENLSPGTTLYFTDNGVKANGCLRESEGIIKYTVPADGLARGSVVSLYTVDDVTCYPSFINGSGILEHMVSGTRFDMNISGEQIIVFEDDGVALTCPDKYIFAVTNNGGWQSDAKDSHTSMLPPGLIAGKTALALPNTPAIMNNARFNCALAESGSKKDILASVVKPANWEGSPSTIYELPKCVFLFGNLFVEYVTYDQIKIKWNDLEPNDELVIIAKEGSKPSAVPFGDGSLYVADSVFGNGYALAPGEFVVYKGNGNTKKSLVITNLKEGKEYYFASYSHTFPSGIIWQPGDGSVPELQKAQVQPVTNVSIKQNGLNTSLSWSNYVGTPQSEWWDGGVLMLVSNNGPVKVTADDLHASAKSTDDFTANQDLSALGGNFVGVTVLYSKPTAAITASFELKQGLNHYIKVFHNDGLVKNEHYWSKGMETDFYLPSSSMNVKGGGLLISNNDVSPSLADLTNMGSTITGTTLTKAYTINNSGEGLLKLIGSPLVQLASNTVFTVVRQPSLTQLNKADGNTQFDIRFDPGVSTGIFTDTVIIKSTDAQHPIYKFLVSAESQSGCFQMEPSTGTPGTVVVLNGSGFTGITQVQFNGVNAVFQLISDTKISATVPYGTNTGNVTVNSAVAPVSCVKFKIIEVPTTCY